MTCYNALYPPCIILNEPCYQLSYVIINLNLNGADDATSPGIIHDSFTHSSPSLVLFFYAIFILAHSVCRSLEKGSTLPICRPRVPTTALPIRTTTWACCFCVRWVSQVHRAPGQKASTHTKIYRGDQIQVQIKGFPRRELSFCGSVCILRKSCIY